MVKDGELHALKLIDLDVGVDDCVLVTYLTRSLEVHDLLLEYSNEAAPVPCYELLVNCSSNFTASILSPAVGTSGTLDQISMLPQEARAIAKNQYTR